MKTRVRIFYPHARMYVGRFWYCMEAASGKQYQESSIMEAVSGKQHQESIYQPTHRRPEDGQPPERGAGFFSRKGSIWVGGDNEYQSVIDGNGNIQKNPERIPSGILSLLEQYCYIYIIGTRVYILYI